DFIATFLVVTPTMVKSCSLYAKLDKTVVVDELVAKELYQDPTAAVNRTFPYKEQLFTIVGVTTNTSGAIGPGNDDSLLYFPKKTYEHYFGKLKDTST
ncbi:ABC transporter permease, partial [Enterococcus faecalis]|uniref:ABC transporter permease n=1 Tax=Enterococcus faecalis TaxID=1351 RepID=UPI001F49E952